MLPSQKTGMNEPRLMTPQILNLRLVLGQWLFRHHRVEGTWAHSDLHVYS